MDGRCCGRRVKGTVVQFVEYNSRIYKVVYEKDDIFWLISFENPAAPFPASKENLILQEMPAEYMDETPASAKRNTTMEKRLKILDEMVYRERGENCPEGWYSEAVFTAASELMGNEEGRNILQKELEKRGVPFTCGRIPGFLS